MKAAPRRGLEGLRVVVTRAPHQARGLGGLLEEAGAIAIYMPTIAIADPESFEGLDAALDELEEGKFSWVVFTSANGITKVAERLQTRRMGLSVFKGTRVAAVGSSSAGVLERLGTEAHLVPEQFTSEALAASMGEGPGTVLLPRGAGAPRGIVEVLKSSGWDPVECVAYRNLPGPRNTQAVRAVKQGKFDVVTFASASSVRRFVEIAGPPEVLGLTPEAREARTVACIGPATAEAARSLGLRVDVLPDEHTGRGLVAALRAHVG